MSEDAEPSNHRTALIIVSGLPGAGKTTAAKRIASKRPAVRFSPDDWLEALGYELTDASGRERVEALQRAMIADVLRARTSAVVEWGTWKRAERDALRDLARRLGVRAELLLLDPPIDTLYARVSQRKSDDRAISLPQLRTWDTEFERADPAERASYDEFTRID